jgi:hypothetical protein
MDCVGGIKSVITMKAVNFDGRIYLLRHTPIILSEGQVRGGKNAGRSTIPSRRFNAA